MSDIVKPAAPEARSRAWLPGPAFAALIAAFVVVLVIATLTYRSVVARAEASAAVSHTNEVQDHLYRLLSQIKDAETGQRGFLLTGDERYLEPYQLALVAIPGQQASVHRLLADNPGQLAQLEALGPLIDGKLATLKQTIEIRRTGDSGGALAIIRTDRGKAMMDRIRETIDLMLSVEQSLLLRRNEEWASSVAWSSYVMFGGALLLVGMLVLIGVLASRDFR
ncbi:MAG TPA: CHASE3 domain-containing protein, partial [Kofleriaceae bacterium]|nr:CHASE3 domain-containing protein [Kofleriaceae bacterium]